MFGFEWRKDKFKFGEEYIQDYDKYSDKGYLVEVSLKYAKELHELHNDLPFLPERMKTDQCA